MTEDLASADSCSRPSRRAFLRGALTIGGAALLTACRSATPSQPAMPARPTRPPQDAAQAADWPSPRQPAPTASASQASAVRTPKPGGTLVAARTADATDLDPQLTPSLARQRITMLTYNNLFRLSNDLTIQPDLAESWRVTPDGRQLDVALRRGVQWHPPVSRELTADDVRFSYQRLLRDSPGRSEFAVIEGVEVLDKYHVRFVLRSANAGILATMADSRWGAIVNRETVERHGNLSKVAVGTGPFVLEAWTPEHEMRFRKHREYFERDKPYLEALVLRILPDEAAIVEGLRSGTIDHAMLEENRYHGQVADQPHLAISRTPRLGYDSLNLNQASPPFDKPEVVQAVSYAVDRAACITAAAGGFAVQTAPATPAMKQWQLRPEQWQPTYTVNLDRARELLARAGHPNGFEATVLTIPTLPTMAVNAQVIRDQLAKIGVHLQIEHVPYGQWLERWQRKEFQATLNTTAGYADPDTAFYRAFHSKAQNWTNRNGPELDRLLDEGRAVFEVERRKPIYDQIQLKLLEQPGQVFLFSAEMIDVAHRRVQGLSQHPTTTLWSYQNAWLDT
ncbi:MAG: hypothetical protein IT306_07520 [Chloroflexi bacterium]|nr:hypothetical protein [Chloroflexota bacterium]